MLTITLCTCFQSTFCQFVHVFDSVSMHIISHSLVSFFFTLYNKMKTITMCGISRYIQKSVQNIYIWRLWRDLTQQVRADNITHGYVNCCLVGYLTRCVGSSDRLSAWTWLWVLGYMLSRVICIWVQRETYDTAQYIWLSYCCGTAVAWLAESNASLLVSCTASTSTR